VNGNRPAEWISDKREILARVQAAKRSGKRVGLVPTMGNLHEGHASLCRQAAAETDLVVATIFVNPIQFGVGEDFASYPRTPAEDQVLCSQAGVDLLFSPSVETMYPPGSCTRVQVAETEKPLCGGNRPGHFVGVATVLTKLFHLIPADVAYFGLKDYQQCLVIEKMVKDLDFPIEIRKCPIVREPDGLAMSSRNRYLSPEERSQAVVLNRALDAVVDRCRQGEFEVARLRQRMLEVIATAPLGRVDYVEILDAADLSPIERVERPAVAALAVRFGKARLIDNRVIDRDGGRGPLDSSA
jgi:pantoate--beta-alanine ligase